MRISINEDLYHQGSAGSWSSRELEQQEDGAAGRWSSRQLEQQAAGAAGR